MMSPAFRNPAATIVVCLLMLPLLPFVGVLLWWLVVSEGMYRASCPGCGAQRRLTRWSGAPSDEAERVKDQAVARTRRARHIGQVAFLAVLLILLLAVVGWVISVVAKM